MKKILLFEHLRHVHKPLILLLQRAGWEMAYFGFSDPPSDKAMLRWIKQRRIANILPLPMPPSQRLALQATETWAAQNRDHPAVRAITDFYESAEGILLIQRCLAETLKKYFFIQYYLQNDPEGLLHDKQVYFLPDTFPASHRLVRSLGLDAPAELPPLLPGFRLWDRLSRLVSAPLALLARLPRLLVLTLLALWQGLLARLGKRPPPATTGIFGITLASFRQLRFEENRRYDYLIDGEHIKKEEVVFLDEVGFPEDFIRSEWQQGNRIEPFLRPPRLADLHHLSPHHALLGDAARLLARTLTVQPGFLGEAVHTAVVNAVLVVFSARKVRFEVLVFSNKESKAQIACNLLFHRLGVKTACYPYAIGGTYLYQHESGQGLYDVADIYWSYLNPQLFLTHTPAMVRYFGGKHPHGVKRFKAIGNLFASMILSVDRAKARHDFFRENHLEERGQKIVAVYDTTYIDCAYCPTTYDTGLAFYEDFHRLARQRRDLVFIFKPSKGKIWYTDPNMVYSNPEKGQKLLDCFARLDALENAVFLHQDRDPTWISALADLVITDGFSSPTCDALAAGKRGFWYDATGNHRGFPLDGLGLVRHGFGELEKGLEEVLNMDDESFRGRFLQEGQREYIDSFMDGLGLERCRGSLRDFAKGGFDF
ncbi:MAG: hypothetical protein HQL56_03865 [Magnetococcales bacterium]|nr:hypothetical protein [Magnetococcales bacterium]